MMGPVRHFVFANTDEEDSTARLDFPDYFGLNRDAFEECLRDIADFGTARPAGFVLEPTQDLLFGLKFALFSCSIAVASCSSVTMITSLSSQLRRLCDSWKLVCARAACKAAFKDS